MSQSENVTPTLSQEVRVDLYKTMLKIRLAELKVAQVYPSDKVQSPIHLSIGQEAIAAGLCRAMRQSDHLYGTYRGHAIYLAKGGGLNEMFAELYAKDTGCARGRGGSMHLISLENGLMGCSAIVASTIPLAAGDALAAKMQKKDRVSVVIFGDGAVDEGVFFETLNFAKLKNLPVIFVCENNNYAVHSPVKDRHPQKDLYRLGEGLGIDGYRHDGLNADGIYAVMTQAIEDVRAGGAPKLFEFMTYRLYEHVGPGKDQHEAYRDQEKLKHALENDSLKQSKAALQKDFAIPEADFAAWQASLEAEIETAVKFADDSPFPTPESLFDEFYKERS